jgi:hypothetical protein
VPKPTYIPKHYRVEIQTPENAPMLLDLHFDSGWRVIFVTPHPDQSRLIFLLENQGTQKNPAK